MKNIIYSSAGILKHVEVREVGFAKINFVFDFGDVVALAGREIIDAPDLIALRKHRAGER